MNEVYVFAGFMKPGRQCLAVAMTCRNKEDGLEDLQYFTHKIVIPHREDDVSHFSKENKISKVVRTFVKANSVFADWIEDSEDTAL